MAREYIPDAMVGSAPGLEIRQRMGRLVASEGGESAHSVALTTLSNKHLEGIPIAQKIGEKQFRYLDSCGKEVSKQKAMAIASGLVYYQEPVDPSKGRLRRHGTFVSEHSARTILSGSKAGSDVANIRDLDGHTSEHEGHAVSTQEDKCDIIEEDLHSIKEEEDVSHSKADEVQTSRKIGHIVLSFRAVAFILLVTIAAFVSLVAKQEMFRSSLGYNSMGLERIERPDKVNYLIGGLPLSPEVASLLKADEVGDDEVLSRALLDMPQPAKAGSISIEERQQQAASEISRILASRTADDILGPGPANRQQQEFRRIALLLHPDKGFVSSSDKRAFAALRLAFAARRQVLAR